MFVIDIPAVCNSTHCAVTRLPLELRVTVSNVPAVVTVVKSPWFARLTVGPSVSAVVALGSKIPVTSTVTKSLPVTFQATKLLDVKFCTSSPTVTVPS